MMTETLHFKELGEFGVMVEKKVREAEMCLKGWLLVCAFSRSSWMEVL